MSNPRKLTSWDPFRDTSWEKLASIFRTIPNNQLNQQAHEVDRDGQTPLINALEYISSGSPVNNLSLLQKLIDISDPYMPDEFDNTAYELARSNEAQGILTKLPNGQYVSQYMISVHGPPPNNQGAEYSAWPLPAQGNEAVDAAGAGAGVEAQGEPAQENPSSMSSSKSTDSSSSKPLPGGKRSKTKKRKSHGKKKSMRRR